MGKDGKQDVWPSITPLIYTHFLGERYEHEEICFLRPTDNVTQGDCHFLHKGNCSCKILWKLDPNLHSCTFYPKFLSRHFH